AEWEAALTRWMRLNAPLRKELSDGAAPGMSAQVMLYQTLVGAWPPELEVDDADGLASYAERLAAWQQKSLREAKLYSSWAAPHEDYEQACRQFLEALFDRARSGPFLEEVREWVQRIAPASIANSLTQTLLRLTSPGMPDLYQGTEFWDFSLVDPDNRRPVDYAARRQALDQAAANNADRQQRQLKQALLQRTLALRATEAELFANGSYVPVHAEGPLQDHVIAFLREYKGRTILVAALRFNLKLMGRDLRLNTDEAAATLLLLPRALHSPQRDIVSGRALRFTNANISVADLLGDYPVALLLAGGEP
ncbi:MAG TPA: malto-oligosyltrehalose synthase, partial [Oxalicibacterium sp.]|nr:malto-oligosyltrehalose synthase [Oxalicibacterium sp.]